MVSKQFYQDIDMVNIGQLIGARHQNVNNADMIAMVTLLGSNNKGLVVWNTDQNKEFVWDGTSFIPHETIQNASTTQAGVVQLNDNINSTSTTQAATPSAVKSAYDLAAAAIPSSQKGVANGIATLDSSGQVPSTQLPSYVDDVLEYLNVAAFPTTGESGKIYVETTGKTTYRWSGSGYTKITSGEVSSVAGKTGVVTLTKSDVGLANVDNTADSAKSVATAAKLTTARTIGGVFFDGTADIDLPGVNTAGNQSTSGNAGSATKLQTARLINGIAFDGTGDINLDVYSKAETDSIAGTPNATETVEGKAKIATTAISRAGTNDTDIITALKLKQTLEASKSVLAGSVNFNGTGTVSIRSQLNVSSITDLGIGKYRINMTTAMPNTNYPVFTSVANRGNAATNIGIEVKEQSVYSITVCTFVTGTGAATDVDFISVGWTR